MNLKDTLQAGGAFASTEVHKRTLKLGKKKTADVYVRELSDTDFRAKVGAPYDRSNLIAAAICDAEGNPVLTIDEAKALKVSIARDLEKLCFQVNNEEGTDDEAGKA
jgi:hypothetical protein